MFAVFVASIMPDTLEILFNGKRSVFSPFVFLIIGAIFNITFSVLILIPTDSCYLQRIS